MEEDNDVFCAQKFTFPYLKKKGGKYIKMGLDDCD